MATNEGLTDLDVLTVGIDLATLATLYAGTSSGGVFKSTDSGGTWAEANTADTLYAGTIDGVWQFTFPTFADGFEPGDACAWSAAVGGCCP